MKQNINIVEVGPRDGFQNIKNRILLEDKLQTIRLMIDAGVSQMEVGSFVSPKAIPQMADIKELVGKVLAEYGERFTPIALVPKRQYVSITGRDQGERDVIAYHTRQSFKPGEITPELANKIGYELAMCFTKGKHAFIVATHIDRAHVHSHIIFNSTALDENQFTMSDNIVLSQLCKVLEVSRSALVIRMRQIGLIVDGSSAGVRT